jgi:hypothetical protein
MSNAALSIHRPKVILAPLILGMIYAIGIPGFIFLWSGQQYILGFAGFEKYGLLYAIICLLGVICNFAIVRGYGWGVIGQLCVWGANLAINIILHRSIAPSHFGLALLFIGFWAFDVYRNRQLLGKINHVPFE